MINTSLREDFLEKHSANCSVKELYCIFQYYYTRYSNHHSPLGVEFFGNCLWYLKRLVNQNKPEKCIQIIYNIEGWDFKNELVETEYVYLMHTVALIGFYYQDYQAAFLWAKKTCSMIDYFHPYLNKTSKENIIQENKNYKDCLKLMEECSEYYNLDKEVESLFIFDWEKRFFQPTNNANQN